MSEKFIDYKKLFEETVGVELPEIIDEAADPNDVIAGYAKNVIEHLVKYENAKRQNSDWIDSITDGVIDIKKKAEKIKHKKDAIDVDFVNSELHKDYTNIRNRIKNRYSDVVNVNNIPKELPDEYNINNILDTDFILRKIGSNYIPNVYSSEEIKNYINTPKFKRAFGVDFYDMKEKGYINE